jgi:glycosyltransferase involved in cell wall biosynthesis
MHKGLVSIIVPCKNSSATMEACLKTSTEQTYPHIELIVVDNHSTDDTVEISKRYTSRVFVKGPERSTQRNFAVEQATGEFVVIIDSDMELSPTVVEECVKEMQKEGVVGVVIPEESFGKGFWAQCKRLERSFYVGVSWMEAARFFRRDLYQKLGGYDEKLVSGEDWDLSQRMQQYGKLGRIPSFIFHNEGALHLRKTLGKKYYYAKKFALYSTKNEGSSQLSNQTGLVKRYALFFSQPGKLLRNPFLGAGMLFMKTAEFLYGGLGLISAKLAASK